MRPRFALVLGAAVCLSIAPSAAAKVTWYWDGPATTPGGTLAAITAAMDEAIDYYNAYGDYEWFDFAPDTRGVRVIYDAGVPTANASYKSRIAFGGQISARTAMHELGHVFGVGTYYPSWPNRLTGGVWNGPLATDLVREFDGPSAVVNGDGAHFWPYGLNQSNEDSLENRRRHVLMVGALRADMRLSNGNATGVLADYNNDGVTDAADFTVYRDRAGDTTSLVNDNSIGSVGRSDLSWWRTNYGRTSAAALAVPEPASCLLAIAAIGVSASLRSRSC